ncbi:glycogen synthase [Paenibacillus daejeonensis]|uniref:glycogen synthase n=1 Tax=Paenibacillus daejeonensis TaxID=135193 RepID=UPI00036F6D7A|nr:glycogen synthase [Paenibacillus daejeonensis]
MNILYAVSEAAPLAKTGGLGDAAAALAKSAAALGAGTTIIMPHYRDIPLEFKREFRLVHTFEVQLGWRRQPCDLLAGEVGGQPFYLLDNAYYFGRSGLYGYADETERFVFFSSAVVAALPYMTEQPDLIHCHDWQSALIPYLLKTRAAEEPTLPPIPTVFTIHNMLYQGRLPLPLMADLLGVAPEALTAETLELYGEACALKGGLLYADRLTTVSESYLDEIQTAEFGGQLDGVIRSRREDAYGWVNGIDTDLYDPMRDPALTAPYRNARNKKVQNKQALQRQLGLPAEGDRPLIGIVSRLTSQKGLDLIDPVLDELVGEDAQLVVLGAGEPDEEARISSWMMRHPRHVVAVTGFDEQLARQIYAASDMFLMPSRYEPCGLSQLIAMQYRSVPVVHATGGLKDTVNPYDPGTGQGEGFVFTELTPEAMLEALRHALAIYREPEQWKGLIAAAAKRDFSWKKAARRYVELYRELLHQRKEKI